MIKVTLNEESKVYKQNYLVYTTGKIFSLRQNRFLKSKPDFHGYSYTTINGLKEKNHRIVATLFIENKNNLPCVNHKNGIKTDNRVENLEWCTYSHNNLHSYRTGLKKNTEKQRKACRESNSKEVLNTETKEVYPSVNDAAKAFGLKPNTLVCYLIGRSKNLTPLQYV